ncbi:MAG: DUF2345 domain-containing protein [Azoarcus sp.]|jgi:type VI secretion system secreted protein VgrG|nr:DUF2345 domain-containing protein [Azoarcus sp.]
MADLPKQSSNASSSHPDSREATASRGPAQQNSGGDIKATLGGTGTVPAWSDPCIWTSAPGGIAQLTPKNHILVSGKSTVLVAEHDIDLVSQGSQALAVKDGLVLFAHGKSIRANKPNQETGLHLHAASGKISLQAQSGQITAAADKKVTIASTEADLSVSASQKILATAGGAYLKIEGGNIELHAPGRVDLKAAMKIFTGPASASGSGVSFPEVAPFPNGVCVPCMLKAAQSGSAFAAKG